MFISKVVFKNQYDTAHKIYNMDITLLPHQILIMPESFIDALDQNTQSKFRIYNNLQMRYNFREYECFSILRH